MHFRYSVLCWCCLSTLACSQLIVNVRNSGGEVYTEKIDANTTQDSITLEFRQSDGTMITQFIDGRNELHLFKAVVLPELELGETQVQTLCFVLRFSKTDFIASDAMSKLRQKNPGAVRHPEDQRPDERSLFDAQLHVQRSQSISPHIAYMCSDAQESTYVRAADVRLLAEILNRNYSLLEQAVRPFPPSSAPPTPCSDISASTNQNACLCRYDLCIGWYPCGLKYCRGKDSTGRVVSYRCGIRTCGLCRSFEFPVVSRRLCSWDLRDFDPESLESGMGGSDVVGLMGDGGVVSGTAGDGKGGVDNAGVNQDEGRAVVKWMGAEGPRPAVDSLNQQEDSMMNREKALPLGRSGDDQPVKQKDIPENVIDGFQQDHRGLNHQGANGELVKQGVAGVPHNQNGHGVPQNRVDILQGEGGSEEAGALRQGVPARGAVRGQDEDEAQAVPESLGRIRAEEDLGVGPVMMKEVGLNLDVGGAKHNVLDDDEDTG